MQQGMAQREVLQLSKIRRPVDMGGLQAARKSLLPNPIDNLILVHSGEIIVCVP